MAAEMTRAYDDDVTDDVFDTGDPRSLVDDLVRVEDARTPALGGLVSPVHPTGRIRAALFGMATRASLRAWRLVAW